jgi:DNA-binding response OmpR family regulator
MVGGLEKLRVLVVEDDFLINQDLCEAIKRAGGEVVGPAMTAEAALELIARGELDGALLDVDLGGVHSADLAHALSERRIPYVVVTGYDTEMIPVEMRSAPRLHKPFSRNELIAEVRRCLGSSAGLAA